VIERERARVAHGDPASVPRVVAAPEPPRKPAHEEGDRGRGFPGVAIGSGVHAEESDLSSREPGLLSKLAQQCSFHELPLLDETARERPHPSERRAPPSDEEDPVPPQGDRVNGERRIAIAGGHSALRCERPRHGAGRIK
jgi:hypothetical protein